MEYVFGVRFSVASLARPQSHFEISNERHGKNLPYAWENVVCVPAPFAEKHQAVDEGPVGAGTWKRREAGENPRYVVRN